MKRTLLLAVALILFTGFCATTLIKRDRTDKVREIQLETKSIDLNKLQLEAKSLKVKYEEELKQKEVNQERIKQLDQENIKIQEQLNQAQKDLQAKARAKEDARLAASRAFNTLTGQGTASASAEPVSGSKASWLAASGIPSHMWADVDWIVSRESGWDPCAYNPGQTNCNAWPTTACGLIQQYPCHKIPGDWRDPVAALKWQYNYVCNTPKFHPYGNCYKGAVGYWKVHGNY